MLNSLEVLFGLFSSRNARADIDHRAITKQNIPPILKTGIAIFGDDRLNAVLRPHIQIAWPIGRRLERTVRLRLKANHEESTSVICESNDFLGHDGSVVIVGSGDDRADLTSVVESKDLDAKRIDLPGLTTFSSLLFLTTLALIRGNHKGWESTEVQSEFATAAVLFTVFIFVELRQELPILYLSYFRNPTFVGANLAGLSFAAYHLTSDLFSGRSRLRRAGRRLAHADGDPY
jgi:hypothetical protein